QPERFPRVGEFVLEWREDGRVRRQAEEQLGVLDRLKLEASILVDRRQAFAPHQFPGCGALGNALQLLLVEAEMIGAVQARPCEEGVRQQGADRGRGPARQPCGTASEAPPGPARRSAATSQRRPAPLAQRYVDRARNG